MGKKIAYQMAQVSDKTQVLCTLEGLMAIADDWTRNESNYTTPVYEEIEASEEFQEMIANSSFYIGLDHPEKPSRSSIISRLREAAGIVRYYERDTDTGEVTVVVDILDTPYGRIANTLARYGSKLGISTRANGDQYDDGTVVEGSVVWFGADLVTQPSQEKARLRLRLNEGKRPTSSKVSKSDMMEALKYVKGKKQFREVERSLLEAVNKLRGGNVMGAKMQKGKASGVRGKKPTMKFKKFGVSGEYLLEGRKILRESTGEDFEVASIDYNPESTMLEVTTSDGIIHEFQKDDAVAATPEDAMMKSAPADIAEEPLVEGDEEGSELDAGYEEFAEPESVDLELEEDFDGEVPATDDENEEDIPAEDIDTSIPVDDELQECEDLVEGDDLVVPDEMDFTEELQEGVTVGSDGDADVNAGEINGAPKRTDVNRAGKATNTVPKPGYDASGIKKPEQVAVGKVSVGEDGYVMLEGTGATQDVRAKVKGRTMNVFKGRTLVEQVTLDKGDNLLECFATVAKDYRKKVATKSAPAKRRK